MAFRTFRGVFGSRRPKIEMAEACQEWREMIFTLPPEAAGVSKSEADRVYGVMMDIGQIDTRTSTHWAISLSAFRTGEAAFHATPGSTVHIEGGEPRVVQAAKEIVQMAQELLPRTNPIQELSLPEPGFIQLFFFTTNGLHVTKGPLDQFQRPGSPFLPLLERFHFIRQLADQISEKNHQPNIKALHVAAFTPEELDQDRLIPLAFFAIDRLKAINPTFNRRMEQMASKTPIVAVSFKHFPKMHTLTSMQASMQAVLKKHNVAFNPTPEDDFFIHGMKDPQGKENFFSFLF